MPVQPAQPVVGDVMGDDDPVALGRMFEALWQMKKLDIATLEKAFAGSE